MPDVRALLRLAYIGRVCVAIGIYVAAAFYFKEVEPGILVMVASAAVLSVSVSAVSAWYTEVRRVAPGQTFLYVQTLFDLALVTAVVHVTGGFTSNFAPLYILVISLSSLLFPFASSLLITLLAGVLYFAVIFWFNPPDLSVALWLQLALFVIVSLAAGWIASKVRAVASERQILEEEVERLRLEASDILDNLRSGILTMDGSGKLSYLNPVAEQLLGLDAEAAIGESVNDLLAEVAPEMARVLSLTQRDGMSVRRFEAEIKRGDDVFPFGLTTTSINVGEGNVSAIFTDISESKRIEDLKLRNERLEAVAEMSASLAHEIKNPLASIRSSVEQLARSMQTGEDEKFLTQLVVRESDRLSGLLSEFLDFARVRVTQRVSLNLLTVVTEAARMAGEHPDCRSGSQVTIEGDDVEINGDEDLIHSIVFNLVLNAIQAAGEGGKVTVTVRHGQPGDIPGGITFEGPAVIMVSDTGPGIPSDLLNRLFEPFVTGRVGGTGLGLAIVQRAVDAHQGVVYVESNQGVGSVFTVVLPSSGNAGKAA